MSWICKLFCPNLLRENSFLRAENGRLVDKYNKLSDKYNKLLSKPKPIDLSYENLHLKKIIKNLNEELTRAKELNPSNVREFNSLSEFQRFVADNDVDMKTFVPTTYDCDNYATETQRNALEQGFIINCQYDRDGNTAHMLNTAFIKGTIYKLEPQTDRIWKFTTLD